MSQQLMPVVSIVFDALTNSLQYPLYLPAPFSTFSVTTQFILRTLKLADTDKVKTLTYSGSNAQITNTGGPKSLEGLTDLANYAVTTGKTAKLILILASSSVSCQFKVWESGTADTASGIAKYTYAGGEFNQNIWMTISPDWDLTPKTFAAGKFITVEVTSTNDVVTVIGAVIIES